MKYAKTLVLAAVAAAALIAVLGTGTASATVLCENNLNTATCGQPHGKTTLFEARTIGVQKFTLKQPEITEVVECKKAAIGGKTENAGSSTETVRLPDTAAGENLVMTFEECGCEVVVVKPGDLEVHFITTTDNGTLTSNGLQVTIDCNDIFGLLHCIYSTSNTDLGKLVGGNPAKLQINATLKRVTTDTLCAETAIWEGEYEVTTPKPLFVTNA